jgi:hypothetical protein
MAPAFKAMELGIIFFAWKNGWLKEKIQGYSWLIKNVSCIRRGRQEIKDLRKVKDKEILRLMSASIKFQDMDNPLLTKVVNPLMEGYFWLAKKIIFW